MEIRTLIAAQQDVLNTDRHPDEIMVIRSDHHRLMGFRGGVVLNETGPTSGEVLLEKNQKPEPAGTFQKEVSRFRRVVVLSTLILLSRQDLTGL